MNGYRLNQHIYGWLCVLLAAIFYSHFRNNTQLALYLDLLHIPELNSVTLPSFIDYHLPSFLQTVFFGYLALFLIKPSKRQHLYIGLMSVTLAGGLELLQLTTILPGTFDFFDLLTILIASTLSIYLFHNQTHLLKPSSNKKQKWFITPILIGSCFVSMGCYYEGCDSDESTCVKPVTLTWDELRADIEPRYGNQETLTSPGKTYALGSYLFIIDKFRGVHIIDQTDNQNPIRIVFIPIQGISSLSIEGNYLYANSFTDLVVIDYQKILDGTFDETDAYRQENIFSPPSYEDFFPDDYAVKGEEEDYEGFIVQDSSSPENGFIIGYYDTDGDTVLYGEYEDANVSYTRTGNPVVDFTLQNNYLITAQSNQVNLYSLSDPTQPALEQTYTSEDDLQLETISTYKADMLIIGTNQGTFFKDHSVPGELDDVDFSELITSCDAIITQGNYMYVTIRSGQACSSINNSSNANKLLVYNTLQASQPVLEKSISINEPYGLDINGDQLFICNDQGLLEFDITTPSSPVQTGDYSQPCNNIIATEDPMILTDDTGIRMIEYANPGLTELAIIRIGE